MSKRHTPLLLSRWKVNYIFDGMPCEEPIFVMASNSHHAKQRARLIFISDHFGYNVNERLSIHEQVTLSDLGERLAMFAEENKL